MSTIVEGDKKQQLRQTKVSDTIIVFDGHYSNLGDYSDGNVTSTVVHSGNEAFVFDSLMYPADTRTLIHAVKDLNLKITGLVNTHWHIDHTAGNQLFLKTNRIISHSLCPDLMRVDNLDWLNKELKEENKIKPTYPNETIENRSALYVGDKNKIEFLHTPGHTPDSIIGWLKDEDVIIAGDTVMELPFVGYGNSKDLIHSLKKIQSIVGRGGKIIQGHGGICGGERLDSDMNYIETVRKRVGECIGSGKMVEQATADIKLQDCIAKERFETIASQFESILWCHPENVKRVYKEFAGK